MANRENPARRICVVTGCRADYGLLYEVMRDLKDRSKIDLQVLVTGAHLAPRFGETATLIEGDGFVIDARVPMDLDSDQPTAIARALGSAVGGIAEAFERLNPDVVVVLGDRYEILAAAQAALILGLPLAHIHGGELTLGAMDDAIRHAVTKMAQLHFVAADAYRKRVIQLGESPERVHLVGALALDNIAGQDLPDRHSLGKEIGFALEQGDYFLITYHPATRGTLAPGAAIGELLAALDDFPDHRMVVTGVNADPGRDAVSGAIHAWAMGRGDTALVVENLGQRRYLAAMKHCAAVVGNSSSGLLEAPALGVPTVNVGERQAGRLRAASVIDCADDAAAIGAAIARATSPAFRAAAADAPYPFGTPGAARRICDILATVPLAGLHSKGFHDLPVEQAL